MLPPETNVEVLGNTILLLALRAAAKADRRELQVKGCRSKDNR